MQLAEERIIVLLLLKFHRQARTAHGGCSMFTSRGSVHGQSIGFVPFRQGHPRKGISIVVLAALSVADGKIILLNGQCPPRQESFHFLS